MEEEEQSSNKRAGHVKMIHEPLHTIVDIQHT